MELHQIRYFLAAADAGNFTRAAERSGISQPSLSHQIIILEKELGHKLFHRLGRRAVLTEAGKVFLDRARRVISEVEDATKALRDSPTLERQIKVGAVQSLAPYLLPPILERCARLHPNLTVHTHEDFRSDLVRGVVEGDLDLAIVPQPVKDPRVSVESLFKEPLLLVVGRGHPLASKPAITAGDLAGEDFVLLGHSSSLLAEIERFCGAHNFVPRLGHRCSQMVTLKALLAGGTGVSIMPRIAFRVEDRKTLVYRELSDTHPTREVVVIRHLQRYQTMGAEQFLKVLRATVAELNAAGVFVGAPSAEPSPAS